MLDDPWYCTREEVKRALDVQLPARMNRAVDRAVASARDAIQGETVRRFAPWRGTRFKDWPEPRQTGPWWRLWLDADECTALDSLVSGGVTLTAGQFLLRPDNAPALGEPFTYIEVDLGQNGAFTAGATWQRSIELTGTFGYTGAANFTPAGTLTTDIDGSAGAATVSDGSTVGVGSLLQLDDEWLIVTGRRQVDTGVTLAADLADRANVQQIPVPDGTAWTPDETITVDAETMLIGDVVGDTLVVERAWDGSTLAAHTAGAHVFSPRQLVVERGQRGTTAAAHTAGATLAVWQPPDLVRQLAVAVAIVAVTQTKAGYPQPLGRSSRTSTSGDRPATRPSDVSDLWDQVCARFARRARTGVV